MTEIIMIVTGGAGHQIQGGLGVTVVHSEDNAQPETPKLNIDNFDFTPPGSNKSVKSGTLRG